MSATTMTSTVPPPAGALASPRPPLPRQRSNSLPLVEVLGCSAAEASLLLAEGTAASVRRRGARRHRRVATYSPSSSASSPAHPVAAAILSTAAAADAGTAWQQHLESPNPTSLSTSLSTPSLCSDATALTPASATSAYSAQLVQFTKSRLASIPSYNNLSHSADSLCHSPIIHVSAPSSPASHGRNDSTSTLGRRSAAANLPRIANLPPPRPPLHSAFSTWSSADGDDDDDYYERTRSDSDDTLTHRRGMELLSQAAAPPDARRESEATTTTIATSMSPSLSKKVPSAEVTSRSPLNFLLPPSPALSAPSSPVRPASYFDRPPSMHHVSFVRSTPPDPSQSHLHHRNHYQPHEHSPQRRSRRSRPPKTLAAFSPYEGTCTAHSSHVAHAVLVESPTRVVVDGMSFDLAHEMHF